MSEPLWAPDERRSAATTLSGFCSWFSARTGKAPGGYREPHRASVADPAEFWSALWDFTEISGDKGALPYLADANRMPGAAFFPDARLNFAENLLRHEGKGDAIVFWGEDKVRRRLSWDVLRGDVSRAS